MMLAIENDNFCPEGTVRENKHINVDRSIEMQHEFRTFIQWFKVKMKIHEEVNVIKLCVETY